MLYCGFQTVHAHSGPVVLRKFQSEEDSLRSGSTCYCIGRRGAGPVHNERYGLSGVLFCGGRLKVHRFTLCPKGLGTYLLHMVISLTTTECRQVIMVPILVAGDRGDAVIVCGSSVEQVKANVDACADDTPLPEVGNGITRNRKMFPKLPLRIRFCFYGSKSLMPELC